MEPARANPVVRLRDQLSSGIPLVGGWFRRQAVKGLAEIASKPAILALAEAVARNDDDSIRSEAFHELVNLASKENVNAREALCLLAVYHNHIPSAREVVEESYAPQEETHRALLYFLTNQWREYESLDFDHALLRAAYGAGSDSMRRRIAAKAREAGRLEWVDIVSGGRQGKRLGAMTDGEWKATLAVLETNGRWEAMWTLAQEAPARWSVAFLRRLHVARWQPPPSDKADYVELIHLAEQWPEVDYSLLMQNYTKFQGHKDEIRSLSFTPDCRFLASASGDATIRLWHIGKKKLWQTLTGHTGTVNCLVISPDGHTLASGGADGVVWLWNLPSGRPKGKLMGHSERIMCVAITPDSRLVASASADGIVQLWEIRDGQSRATLRGHDASVLSMAITPAGDMLVTSGADNTVRLWDLPHGKLHRTLRGHRDDPGDAILCLALSPDGNLLASGGTDETIELRSLPGGGTLATLEGHLGDVSCLAFNPEGTLLMSGGGDQNIRFWSIPSGELLDTRAAHSGKITGMIMSPDGTFAASVSGYGLGHDHSLRLWSPVQRRQVKTLYGHSRYITCLAITSDGRFLATGGGDRAICLWTSELARLTNMPARQTHLDDLELAQRSLRNTQLSVAEIAAWKFIAVLLRRQRRMDIMVDEAAARVVEIGEFDIEIES